MITTVGPFLVKEWAVEFEIGGPRGSILYTSTIKLRNYVSFGFYWVGPLHGVKMEDLISSVGGGGDRRDSALARIESHTGPDV